MASSKKTKAPKENPQESAPADAAVDDVAHVSGDAAEGHSSELSMNETPSEPSTVVAEDQPDALDPPVEQKTDVTDTVVTPAQSKSVFVPLVLGGVVAGAIGFLLGQQGVFGTGQADFAVQVQSELTAQQERLTELEAVPAIELPDLTPVLDQLSVLDARISALEERPAIVVPEGVDADAAAAYAAELRNLQASVEAQRSEIESLLSNARTVEEATADAAQAAQAQAALATIVSALDAGQPFSQAVQTLGSLGFGEVDPALTSSAAEGVATLSVLQAEFPERARNALAAARASAAGDGQQGIGGFLQRSLGARSIAPREGDDPDAVLSRAEAAIKAGDLSAALGELDALPEAARVEISDWRSAADARVSALAAAGNLSQRLTAD